MKIVVITRCYNEEKNVERFLHGYSFADKIIVADGGSTDNSKKLLRKDKKVEVLDFKQIEILNGQRWNPDNPHLQFVIDAGVAENPDWLILDDFDCVPNKSLRDMSTKMFFQDLDFWGFEQINAFRLYLWGDTEYFPKMNNWFDPLYRSLWAWKPSKLNVRADLSKHHGTILGTVDKSAFPIELPCCLLHKSWHPDTIEEKLKFYKDIGIQMGHPYMFAGKPESLPEWARE